MIAALLLAQATVGPVLDAAPPHENIKLGWDAKARLCSVKLHGGEIGDPRTEDGRTALIQALPDAERSVDLLRATDVPFLCMQGVIDALQKSGRPYKIGFVAEPPPKP